MAAKKITNGIVSLLIIVGVIGSFFSNQDLLAKGVVEGVNCGSGKMYSLEAFFHSIYLSWFVIIEKCRYIQGGPKKSL